MKIYCATAPSIPSAVWQDLVMQYPLEFCLLYFSRTAEHPFAPAREHLLVDLPRMQGALKQNLTVRRILQSISLYTYNGVLPSMSAREISMPGTAMSTLTIGERPWDAALCKAVAPLASFMLTSAPAVRRT
jgi:hypothetical protein